MARLDAFMEVDGNQEGTCDNKVLGGRERLVLLTTLCHDDIALEVNMLPCK